MFTKMLFPALLTSAWALVAASLLTPSTSEAHDLTAPHRCSADTGDIIGGRPDPGVPGPFSVVTQEYGAFGENIELKDFGHPSEFLGEVVYPSPLDCGPFPIVFMMHGAHKTCYDPSNNNKYGGGWPCLAPSLPLPNYKGCHYLAELLASHGIVTVSIGVNSINQHDFLNLQARARLFLRHIGYWTEANDVGNGDLGTLFKGRIDLKRIGVLGHSRGGDGAARLVDLINGPDASPGSLTAKGNDSDIKAVLRLAPAEGDDADDNRVTGTALGVVLPYCDGDQVDLPGVKYFDASRYALPGDNVPKHAFEVMGANHNYYNVYWGPNDLGIEYVDDRYDGVSHDDKPFCQEEEEEEEDDAGSGLSPAEQRATLLAIGGAFFRTYLLNETAFQPFLRGEAPPPPSAMTDGIFVAYHPKDDPESRLDLNRLAEQSEASTNTLGGRVTHENLARFEYCAPGEAGAPHGCVTDENELYFTGGAPHGFTPDPTNQLRLAWDNIGPRPVLASLLQELPPGSRDASTYRAVQFRAFVDYTDARNPHDQPQDLRIVLHDGAGQSADVVVSDYSRALFFPPPGNEAENDFLPIQHAILNTVRVPLSAFPGLFLTDLRSVELAFDRTPMGAINVADFAFADEAANTPPRLSCQMAETELASTGDRLLNVGLDVQVTDDADIGLVPAISVYSDEDDQDGGPADSSPDARDIAPGTLRLRLENDSAGDGRVYLVVATARDSEGARGAACCTAVVPSGNQPEVRAAVLARAAEARDQCTAFAAASIGQASTPVGYFAVGDGPVTGPKQ